MARRNSLQVHHLLWERREWNECRLGKRLRNDPMFKVQLASPVHRLLHLDHDPIPLPEQSVLQDMAGMMYLGMVSLIDCLDHPIAYHLDQQLHYVDMPVGLAVKKLRGR